MLRVAPYLWISVFSILYPQKPLKTWSVKTAPRYSRCSCCTLLILRLALTLVQLAENKLNNRFSLYQLILLYLKKGLSLFSASTKDYNKWSPGKPTDNICQTAETGKGQFGHAAVGTNRPPWLFRTSFKPAFLSCSASSPSASASTYSGWRGPTREPLSNGRSTCSSQSTFQWTATSTTEPHRGAKGPNVLRVSLRQKIQTCFLKSQLLMVRLNISVMQIFFHPFFVVITRIVFLIIKQVSIAAATTTTNLLRMGPAHLYFSTQTQTSALPAIMGKH